MSRRNRRQLQKASRVSAPSNRMNTTDAINSAFGQKMTLDVFMNQMARTGEGSVNLMNGTAYPLTRMTRLYNLLNSLYRNNWIPRAIIDIPAYDMVKNWIKYLCDFTPDQLDMIQHEEKRTKLRSQLLEGLIWGRLYGGAGGLMVINGQENLEEPLDIDRIMPGDYEGMIIVDRWSGIYPLLELVEDVSDPDFGLPKYYEFRNPASFDTVRVHHSRIVRFTGLLLPEWEKEAESYWGESILEPCFEEIKKRDNTSANIAGLIFLANIKVLKMKDLAQLLGSTNEKAVQQFYSTIQSQNWLLSNFGQYIMDQDDDIAFHNASFSGLHEVYELFMMDVAGAARIPVTKLFGRSPAGMNATGESDLENYYDSIENQQEAHLRPQLEKVGPVLCMSTLGYIPDDWDFQFNPVRTPSEEERSNSIKNRSEAVYGAHDRGLISDKIALMELKQMSEDSGLFSSITDDIINNASEEVQKPLLEVEGFGDTPPDEKLEGESPNDE